MKKIVLAPYIDQTERWVNGCESISAVMALGAVGVPVDPDTFIARDLPHAPFWEQDGVLWGPDPHYVYPGDPHDHTGYGCYAPCICQALRSALEAEGAADAFEVVDETLRGGGRDGAHRRRALRRLHRPGAAGGLLGDAGLPAGARLRPLDAAQRPPLRLEAERALPAPGWLRRGPLLVQRPVAQPRPLPPAQGPGGGMPPRPGDVCGGPAEEIKQQTGPRPATNAATEGRYFDQKP